MAGDKMLEFVGLRAKVYAYRSAVCEQKKLKGMKTYVVKRDIHFSNYMNVLQDQTAMRHVMNTFRSDNHNVQTVAINKVSLSCFDDKRYILEDGVSTLAHGHFKISNIDCK